MGEDQFHDLLDKPFTIPRQIGCKHRWFGRCEAKPHDLACLIFLSIKTECSLVFDCHFKIAKHERVAKLGEKACISHVNFCNTLKQVGVDLFEWVKSVIHRCFRQLACWRSPVRRGYARPRIRNGPIKRTTKAGSRFQMAMASWNFGFF
jgi:hypothetical protein